MDTFNPIQLPISFDPSALKADLAKIRAEEWINHYSTSHHQGRWGVVPLRSVGGHPQIIYASPSGIQADFYKDTPILERCTYFQEVIGWFQCQVNAARLMLLAAGARILEHTDEMQMGELVEWRIHVPVLTHPTVRFVVNQILIPMREGEVWLADFNLPHSVDNDSPVDRVHLVLDCLPNDWLREQLEKGHPMLYDQKTGAISG
ncbi:MAG TPA: aspartyl/asparaginyl beta-hydroxylase domain-containing protein [Saprospiraceae bacterium]|nr:aspartyl/asparaginyl beta-hydroxylase domain-containing protein [Saprospiraceae bacterium]HMQ83862.1 aspartyl/asparaginyl beta-hydroxylase domain-containing protein [Saprospiraceae bacterium]